MPVAQVRTSMFRSAHLLKSSFNVIFGFSWRGRYGCRKRWANLIVARTFQELGLVRNQSARAYFVSDMLAARRSDRDSPFYTHLIFCLPGVFNEKCINAPRDKRLRDMGVPLIEKVARPRHARTVRFSKSDLRRCQYSVT